MYAFHWGSWKEGNKEFAMDYLVVGISCIAIASANSKWHKIKN